MPDNRKIGRDGFTCNQREMIRRRKLDPANFRFIKETYCALYLRDKRDGSIKIINKQN